MSDPSILEMLADPELSPSRRHRLEIFQKVERGISSRVEQLCTQMGMTVTDVAVLVIAPEAQHLFFQGAMGKETDVVIGHRTKLHGFLTAILPPEPGGGDPYEDLLEPASEHCVRVLIVDDTSMTVLCYGTFITVNLKPSPKPAAEQN